MERTLMTGINPGLYSKSNPVLVDVEAVRGQAERILADPLFRNSKRYSNLLRFIVDRTLSGQTDDLREKVIGVEVFQRSPGYDTSVDPTVRVAASEVRKRLALYYSESMHEPEIRIEVPVRSYVAEFRFPDEIPSRASIGEDLQPQNPELRLKHGHFQPPSLSRRRALSYTGVGVALLISALSAWDLRRVLSLRSALSEFWAPVTAGATSILVCIGSSSLGTNPAQVGSTTSGTARTGPEELPAQRGNVPMTDVNVAIHLDTFLRSKVENTVLSPANGTSLSDLRSRPELLIGSFDNEWTMRLGANLHYRFRRESDMGLRWIENSADPGKKDWAVDLSSPQDQRGTDYALISRVLDQTTGQWWVGIGGLTGLGTLAAAQMVTDSKSMTAVASQLPNGWERKNLQVVLAIEVVQDSSGVPRAISTYSW